MQYAVKTVSGIAALVFSINAFCVSAPVVDSNPKLIVVVSVDQLRRDRVTDEFPGGLGLLSRDGRVFVDAQLDHGITNTCPGHSVLLTGVTPGKAGIPGNTYIDKKSFEQRYCVDDDNDEFRVIGGSNNRSPRNLRVSTFGDWLKAKYPESRVFAVGGKDRAVITMGGHKADGVFWFNSRSGRFTSSGYYMKSLPDYVNRFNGDDPLVDGHLRDVADTWVHPAGVLRADDYEGESETYGRVSGHPLKKGDEPFRQMYRSPVVDTQSFELARIIVEEEKLGEGDHPDVLLIALSATDTVGHLYGPRSAEAEATLNNIDSLLAKLIQDLETKLGVSNILFVLSADHGVAELPEYMADKETSSCPEKGRSGYLSVFGRLYWSLYWNYTRPFDSPEELVKFTGGQFTVNRQYLAENEIELDEVLTTLNAAFAQSDIVKRTWTQQQIIEGKTETARLLRNSLTQDRSGDLTVQLHPDCVLSFGEGTTHGSVYDYDRDVPLIFYGWGVEAGKIKGSAHSIDIGPTLAKHLGIESPENLDGKVLMLDAR